MLSLVVNAKAFQSKLDYTAMATIMGVQSLDEGIYLLSYIRRRHGVGVKLVHGNSWQGLLDYHHRRKGLLLLKMTTMTKPCVGSVVVEGRRVMCLTLMTLRSGRRHIDVGAIATFAAHIQNLVEASSFAQKPVRL